VVASFEIGRAVRVVGRLNGHFSWPARGLDNGLNIQFATVQKGA
jgi:hypothetical protein